MYNRVLFENELGDILCASHTMDVFIVNDIVDYQSVISNLFIRSVNLPYETYVSSSLVQYSNITHQVSFTLQDNAIRQVCNVSIFYYSIVVESVLSIQIQHHCCGSSIIIHLLGFCLFQ